jgi:flagellar hook-associated protein 1 FlgK
MPGLTGIMYMAEQSLQANQGALDVTTNNISNASTPGYSREQAILAASTPMQEGDITYGTGVMLQQVQSIRDQILELRIAEETQQQSSAQAQYNSLQQVQALFSDPTQGIGNDLTAFFNSLNQLSTNPTSIPQRQAVLTTAQNLVGDFHQTENNLNTIQTGLNQSVVQTVSQINSLTQQIAQLNQQVGEMQKLGQSAGVLQDQETQLIDQLSQLADVNIIQTEQGQTITTAGGAALVVGGQSFALQTSAGASGMEHIIAQGRDITSQFQGGQLAGTLQVRDQVIPGLLNQIDNLASDFATNINGAQAAGFDLNGNQGQALFSVTPGAGAASSLAVAFNDASLIAASSDGTPGSNGNIANLMAVQTQALPSGADPLDTYANLVSSTGNLTSQAQAEVNASTVSLNQLNDQRGAISGVSIDEETTNLMNYQRAYEAAARIVTTVDELTQSVLQMGASAPTAP